MTEKKRIFPVLSALIIYTAIMIYFMFFGFGRMTYTYYLYNFVPFKTIHESFEIYIWYVKNIPDSAKNVFRHLAFNTIGNIVMFMPFGILLTTLFNGSFKKAFIVFIIGIITLETAQLISRRGVFDVDDILLNSMGFLIGYATVKLISLLINKFREKRLE